MDAWHIDEARELDFFMILAATRAMGVPCLKPAISPNHADTGQRAPLGRRLLMPMKSPATAIGGHGHRANPGSSSGPRALTQCRAHDGFDVFALDRFARLLKRDDLSHT